VQAVQVDGMVSQNPWQDHGYRNLDGWVSWKVLQSKVMDCVHCG
jgi:hypothetical protein